MRKGKNISVLLAIFLGVFLLAACEPETVSSEEKRLPAKPAAALEKIANTEPITIAAVGDIMLGSTSIDETFLPPNDGSDMLSEVAPILSAADIAFGNLEGPMLEGGETEKCPPDSKMCFAFRMPTRYAKHLKEAGFDVLNLANNHSLDFGIDGVKSTRKALDEAGIKHTGSDKFQLSTTYLEVKGKTVAFIGFAHNDFVPNINNLASARRLVSEADKKADLVIVSFHGGTEGAGAQRVPYNTEMLGKEKRGNLRLFSRTVIDAGADLALGHGPHVLRGMEIYKDRLIAYSMGNFATYGMFSLKAEKALTAIFEIEIAPDGKFLGGKIYPGKQVGRGIPVLDKSNAAVKKLRFLSAADFGANAPKIADDGTISPK